VRNFVIFTVAKYNFVNQIKKVNWLTYVGL
jgi:hypothetical protein